MENDFNYKSTELKFPSNWKYLLTLPVCHQSDFQRNHSISSIVASFKSLVCERTPWLFVLLCASSLIKHLLISHLPSLSRVWTHQYKVPNKKLLKSIPLLLLFGVLMTNGIEIKPRATVLLATGNVCLRPYCKLSEIIMLSLCPSHVRDVWFSLSLLEMLKSFKWHEFDAGPVWFILSNIKCSFVIILLTRKENHTNYSFICSCINLFIYFTDQWNHLNFYWPT